MAWHWAGAAAWARAPFAASVEFWTLQATVLCRHSRLTVLKQFHPDILYKLQPTGSFPLAEHWTFPQQLQGKQGRDHKKTGMQRTLTFRGLFPLYPFLSRGSLLIPLHLHVSIFTYSPYTDTFAPSLTDSFLYSAHIDGMPTVCQTSRAQMVKASVCNARDLGSIPGWGRSAGEGKGNPLQDSCLEISMHGGASWVTVYGVIKSRTGWSDFTLTFKDG